MSRKSELWLRLSNRLSGEEFTLANFRNPDEAWINSKFASWQPNESTLRWYRSFVLAKGMMLDDHGYEIYKNIGNTSLGKPVAVRIARPDDDLRIDGGSGWRKVPLKEFIEVNLDHLLVVGEIIFLELAFKNLEFPKTIVEIGAGFGRTCQGILSHFNSISRYEIIDLPEVLKISRSYLQSVLSEKDFKKVHFISAENTKKEFSSADLCIQIDGLQEMDAETIDFYYDHVVESCTSFFSSNPIAKYLPEHGGIKSDVDIPSSIYSLGKSLDIADIWDMKDLQGVREKHISNYLPKNFRILCSAQQDIFPHYENTLYVRDI